MDAEKYFIGICIYKIRRIKQCMIQHEMCDYGAYLVNILNIYDLSGEGKICLANEILKTLGDTFKNQTNKYYLQTFTGFVSEVTQSKHLLEAVFLAPDFSQLFEQLIGLLCDIGQDICLNSGVLKALGLMILLHTTVLINSQKNVETNTMDRRVKKYVSTVMTISSACNRFGDVCDSLIKCLMSKRNQNDQNHWNFVKEQIETLIL